jgi:hypothetical protein
LYKTRRIAPGILSLTLLAYMLLSAYRHALTNPEKFYSDVFAFALVAAFMTVTIVKSSRVYIAEHARGVRAIGWLVLAVGILSLVVLMISTVSTDTGVLSKDTDIWTMPIAFVAIVGFMTAQLPNIVGDSVHRGEAIRKFFFGDTERKL